MPTYKRFEDLPVWQDAVQLMVLVDRLTSEQIFQRKRSYQDQLERATLSISNNIAEGFERGTTKELLMFLYIARGSAGEVRSMCLVFERLPEFVHLKLQISDLRKSTTAGQGANLTSLTPTSSTPRALFCVRSIR